MHKEGKGSKRAGTGEKMESWRRKMKPQSGRGERSAADRGSVNEAGQRKNKMSLHLHESLPLNHIHIYIKAVNIIYKGIFLFFLGFKKKVFLLFSINSAKWQQLWPSFTSNLTASTTSQQWGVRNASPHTGADTSPQWNAHARSEHHWSTTAPEPDVIVELVRLAVLPRRFEKAAPPLINSSTDDFIKNMSTPVRL